MPPIKDLFTPEKPVETKEADKKLVLPYDNFDKEFAILSKRFMESPSIVKALKRKHERLESFLIECFKAKTPLAESLGLGSDFRASFNIEAALAIENSPFYIALWDFLVYMYGRDRNTFNIIVNGDEEGRRLPKMIADNKIKTGGREYRLSRYFGKLFTPENFTNWISQSPHRNRIDRRCHAWDQFSSTLFDQAATAQRKVYISANPMDILLSSEAAGFRSCHSWDGVHATGNVAYAMDGFTAIVFLHQNSGTQKDTFPFFKVNRMWLYTDPHTRLAYTLGKSYGLIDEAQQKQISEGISKRLASVKGVSDTWRFKAPVDYPTNKLKGVGHAQNQHGGYAVYFDLTASRFVYHESLKGDGKKKLEELIPELSFETPRCLACGNRHQAGERMVCKNCRNSSGFDFTCGAGCGYGSDEAGNFREMDGIRYCNQCFQRHFYSCHSCEKMEARDRAMRTTSHLVCRECFDKNYFRCAHSGEFSEKKFGVEAYSKAGKKVMIRKKYLGETHGFFETLEEAQKAREQEAQIRKEALERAAKVEQERRALFETAYSHYENKREELLQAAGDKNFDAFERLFQETFGSLSQKPEA